MRAFFLYGAATSAVATSISIQDAPTEHSFLSQDFPGRDLGGYVLERVYAWEDANGGSADGEVQRFSPATPPIASSNPDGDLSQTLARLNAFWAAPIHFRGRSLVDFPGSNNGASGDQSVVSALYEDVSPSEKSVGVYSNSNDHVIVFRAGAASASFAEVLKLHGAAPSVHTLRQNYVTLLNSGGDTIAEPALNRDEEGLNFAVLSNAVRDQFKNATTSSLADAKLEAVMTDISVLLASPSLVMSKVHVTGFAAGGYYAQKGSALLKTALGVIYGNSVEAHLIATPGNDCRSGDPGATVPVPTTHYRHELDFLVRSVDRAAVGSLLKTLKRDAVSDWANGFDEVAYFCRELLFQNFDETEATRRVELFAGHGVAKFGETKALELCREAIQTDLLLQMSQDALNPDVDFTTVSVTPYETECATDETVEAATGKMHSAGCVVVTATENETTTTAPPHTTVTTDSDAAQEGDFLPVTCLPLDAFSGVQIASPRQRLDKGRADFRLKLVMGAFADRLVSEMRAFDPAFRESTLDAFREVYPASAASAEYANMFGAADAEPSWSAMDQAGAADMMHALIVNGTAGSQRRRQLQTIQTGVKSSFFDVDVSLSLLGNPADTFQVMVSSPQFPKFFPALGYRLSPMSFFCRNDLPMVTLCLVHRALTVELRVVLGTLVLYKMRVFEVDIVKGEIKFVGHNLLELEWDYAGKSYDLKADFTEAQPVAQQTERRGEFFNGQAQGLRGGATGEAVGVKGAGTQKTYFRTRCEKITQYTCPDQGSDESNDLAASNFFLFQEMSSYGHNMSVSDVRQNGEPKCPAASNSRCSSGLCVCKPGQCVNGDGVCVPEADPSALRTVGHPCMTEEGGVDVLKQLKFYKDASMGAPFDYCVLVGNQHSYLRFGMPFRDGAGDSKFDWASGYLAGGLRKIINPDFGAMFGALADGTLIADGIETGWITFDGLGGSQSKMMLHVQFPYVPYFLEKHLDVTFGLKPKVETIPGTATESAKRRITVDLEIALDHMLPEAQVLMDTGLDVPEEERFERLFEHRFRIFSFTNDAVAAGIDGSQPLKCIQLNADEAPGQTVSMADLCVHVEQDEDFIPVASAAQRRLSGNVISSDEKLKIDLTSGLDVPAEENGVDYDTATEQKLTTVAVSLCVPVLESYCYDLKALQLVEERTVRTVAASSSSSQGADRRQLTTSSDPVVSGSSVSVRMPIAGTDETVAIRPDPRAHVQPSRGGVRLITWCCLALGWMIFFGVLFEHIGFARNRKLNLLKKKRGEEEEADDPTSPVTSPAPKGSAGEKWENVFHPNRSLRQSETSSPVLGNLANARIFAGVFQPPTNRAEDEEEEITAQLDEELKQNTQQNAENGLPPPDAVVVRSEGKPSTVGSLPPVVGAEDTDVGSRLQRYAAGNIKDRTGLRSDPDSCVYDDGVFNRCTPAALLGKLDETCDDFVEDKTGYLFAGEGVTDYDRVITQALNHLKRIEPTDVVEPKILAPESAPASIAGIEDDQPTLLTAEDQERRAAAAKRNGRKTTTIAKMNLDTVEKAKAEAKKSKEEKSSSAAVPDVPAADDRIGKAEDEAQKRMHQMIKAEYKSRKEGGGAAARGAAQRMSGVNFALGYEASTPVLETQYPEHYKQAGNIVPLKRLDTESSFLVAASKKVDINMDDVVNSPIVADVRNTVRQSIRTTMNAVKPENLRSLANRMTGNGMTGVTEQQQQQKEGSEHDDGSSVQDEVDDMADRVAAAIFGEDPEKNNGADLPFAQRMVWKTKRFFKWIGSSLKSIAMGVLYFTLAVGVSVWSWGRFCLHCFLAFLLYTCRVYFIMGSDMKRLALLPVEFAAFEKIPTMASKSFYILRKYLCWRRSVLFHFVGITFLMTAVTLVRENAMMFDQLGRVGQGKGTSDDMERALRMVSTARIVTSGDTLEGTLENDGSAQMNTERRRLLGNTAGEQPNFTYSRAELLRGDLHPEDAKGHALFSELQSGKFLRRLQETTGASSNDDEVVARAPNNLANLLDVVASLQLFQSVYILIDLIVQLGIMGCVTMAAKHWVNYRVSARYMILAAGIKLGQIIIGVWIPWYYIFFGDVEKDAETTGNHFMMSLLEFCKVYIYNIAAKPLLSASLMIAPALVLGSMRAMDIVPFALLPYLAVIGIPILVAFVGWPFWTLIGHWTANYYILYGGMIIVGYAGTVAHFAWDALSGVQAMRNLGRRKFAERKAARDAELAKVADEAAIDILLSPQQARKSTDNNNNTGAAGAEQIKDQRAYQMGDAESGAEAGNWLKRKLSTGQALFTSKRRPTALPFDGVTDSNMLAEEAVLQGAKMTHLKHFVRARVAAGVMKSNMVYATGLALLIYGAMQEQAIREMVFSAYTSDPDMLISNAITTVFNGFLDKFLIQIAWADIFLMGLVKLRLFNGYMAEDRLLTNLTYLYNYKDQYNEAFYEGVHLAAESFQEHEERERAALLTAASPAKKNRCAKLPCRRKGEESDEDDGTMAHTPYQRTRGNAVM